MQNQLWHNHDVTRKWRWHLQVGGTIFSNCLLLTSRSLCNLCWTLDVSRTVSFEITLVRLSFSASIVCQSAHLSVRLSARRNFSQDWIFSFFWSLVVLVTRIWAKGSKSGPKLGFCFFQKFGSLVFLEIPHNNSLQEEGKKEVEDEARLHNSLEEFLTISGGKTHKKIWGPKFVPNRPRSGLKLDFPLFPQVWFGISSSFSLHYIGS